MGAADLAVMPVGTVSVGVDGITGVVVSGLTVAVPPPPQPASDTAADAFTGVLLRRGLTSPADVVSKPGPAAGTESVGAGVPNRL